MLEQLIFRSKPFVMCHSPSIALFKGQLFMACYAGKYEGHREVGIWLSVIRENLWDVPIEVVNSKSVINKKLPCWNPVLFTIKNKIVLFFKTGNSPSNWRGYYIESENGESWTSPKSMPGNFVGPTKNKPILVNNIIISPSSDEKFGNYIHFEVSKNFLKSWLFIEPKHGVKNSGAIQPTIFSLGMGRLVAYSRSEIGKILKCYSDDYGLTWGKLKPTDLPNPDSGIDGVSIKNDLHLLVYNKSTNSRTNLTIAISKDVEKWKDLFTLESKDGEYSYPSIINSDMNTLHIVYTYNRLNIKYVEIKLNDKERIRKNY